MHTDIHICTSYLLKTAVAGHVVRMMVSTNTSSRLQNNGSKLYMQRIQLPVVLPIPSTKQSIMARGSQHYVPMNWYMVDCSTLTAQN